MESKRYFEQLASLRFFAALLVLLSHINLSRDTHIRLIKSLDHDVFWCGFIGVSIFYVLSGFVISYANDNWQGWRRYLIGRVSRIYPAHLIVTLLVILVLGEKIDSWKTTLEWVVNLSLLQAWVPSYNYLEVLNDVSWSLSVEIFFYVSFIFLRKLQDRYIYGLCGFAYLLNLSLELALQGEPHRWVHLLFYFNPPSRLPEFLIGMSIYRIYRGGWFKPRWLNYVDFLPIFLLMITVISTLHVMGINVIFLYSSIPALFAFCIVMSLIFGHSSRYMQNRGLVLLGEASFALYLIHKPMLKIGYELIRKYQLPGALYLMLFVAILAVGSSIAFHLKVEIPVTRHVRRFLSKTLTSGAPAAGQKAS